MLARGEDELPTDTATITPATPRRPRRTAAKVRGLAAATARWSMGVVRIGVHRGLSAAASLRGATIELMYPAACVSCGTEINSDDRRANELPFCDVCFESFELLQEPLCRRCGGPLPSVARRQAANDFTQDTAPSPSPRPEGESSEVRIATCDDAEGCYRCRRHKMWFDETIAAGLYEGWLREQVLRMKNDKGDPLSLAMGQLLWQLRRDKLQALGVDVVAPIPLHWRRRLTHRTNSAAVLAEVLARQLRVPLADGLLRRPRATQPQSELTPPQRWHNVRHAFRVGGSHHLREAHVLIVDDILTTGATCSEAARALRKAGASRVSIAVVARAVG